MVLNNMAAKYYVKESGYDYHKLHGPYDTQAEAAKNMPADRIVGQATEWVTYWVARVGNDT